MRWGRWDLPTTDERFSLEEFGMRNEEVQVIETYAGID